MLNALENSTVMSVVYIEYGNVFGEVNRVVFEEIFTAHLFPKIKLLSFSQVEIYM